MDKLAEPRYVTTSIRVTEEERAIFHELAERLNKRSLGAAVRAVVFETVNILREQEQAGSNGPRGKVQAI